MRIIFFGTPEFAVPCLERLLQQQDFQVLGVVTQPDKRRGRGNQLIPSPVKIAAMGHQLPIWQPRRIKKDTETLAQLQALEADVFVVVAYGQILSQQILDLPRLGCINAHGSILPRYRGAAPIQWCLYHGERQTGITTMLMDAGMDTGPMLLKTVTPVFLLDNRVTLSERLAEMAAELVVDTVLQLDAETLEPEPQPHEEATYAPLIRDEDYQLDWNKSAIALHNQVRGFCPSCVTAFRGNVLKVSATVPVHPDYWLQMPGELRVLEQYWSELAEISGQPGEVVKIVKRLGPVIQTGDGLLLLREVQLAGKRSQTGWDFANGTRLGVTEVLG